MRMTTKEIMKLVPTDSSGKWVAIDEVYSIVDSVLSDNWDHYSGLPSPTAYQTMKDGVE